MHRFLKLLTTGYVLIVLAGCGGESPDVLERARAEAKTVDATAELVQVEFLHFGFAAGSGGIPDMTKAGPPKLALLNFYSRQNGTGFRIVADINRDPPPAEIAKRMQKQGYRDLRVERGQTAFAPFTLPLAKDIGELDRVLKSAQAAIAGDCAQAKSAASSCALVQRAELHMHWSGPKDRDGVPVWTVDFGQHPQTLETVRRTVAASNYRVTEGRDAQSSTFDTPEGSLRAVELTVPREFGRLWPAVVEAVQKQDPLYAPYAVSLITYVRDRRASGDKVPISEAHIQFARLTPSLIWDDIEAHVGWQSGSDSRARLFFSQPRRRMAPQHPKPITLEKEKLPRADDALGALISKFPDGYAEVSTTWTKGCEDVLTASPGLTMWRCGVYVATQQRSDLVFLWLTHPKNPYWQSGRAPLATEYHVVAAAEPKDRWSWWTRVKHPADWEYFRIDALGGAVRPSFCTNPNTGRNEIQLRPCGR